MFHPYTLIRKVAFGFCLLVFSIAACDSAFAFVEEASQATSVAPQEPTESETQAAIEEPETDQDDPAVEPTNSDSSDRPRKANQDDSATSDNVASEKQQTADAESNDVAGSTVAGEIAADTDAEQGTLREVDGSAAAASKKSEPVPLLTPGQFGWIFKGIFAALFIGFLLWLLSLMTSRNKSKFATPSSKPESSNNNALSPKASGAANANAASIANINEADIGKGVRKPPRRGGRSDKDRRR